MAGWPERSQLSKNDHLRYLSYTLTQISKYVLMIDLCFELHIRYNKEIKNERYNFIYNQDTF